MSRKNKPVPFSENNKRDMELLAYAESQDLAFATYIKNLIEKDMQQNNTKINKNELKELMKEVLKEMNVNASEIKDTTLKEHSAVTSTQKKSIKGILSGLKK